jgi:hypothetical protein
MPPPIQTNKEFVEAAGIAECDAFLAVAIRRIVARMLEIPAQELTAEKTFETIMRQAGFYTDWDELCFVGELVEQFKIKILYEEWERGQKAVRYSNWFYNPGTTFGEWVKIGVEIILISCHEKIVLPTDWPGLEASDLESDTVILKSPVHNAMRCFFWGITIICVIVILLNLFR